MCNDILTLKISQPKVAYMGINNQSEVRVFGFRLITVRWHWLDHPRLAIKKLRIISALSYIIFFSGIFWAADIPVLSLSGNGLLTWINFFTNALFTVQWAPSMAINPTNPIRSDSWIALKYFCTPTGGTTVPVQMFCRVRQLPALAAGADLLESARERLAEYRDELHRLRAEFGGTRDLPDERFYLFGMGLREKFFYRAGALLRAPSAEIIKRWDIAGEIILPADYTVILRTQAGETVRISEDEHGVWIEEAGGRVSLPGTELPVKLPWFEGYRYPQVLRVLHQELLVNVLTNGPVPNLFVYRKPWYRDGAMMAMAFRETGNLAVIRSWILSLRQPYDRNNAGETEADNLGQALFLVSLVSNTNHPLVASVLAEVQKYERTMDGTKFIQGRSDFAEHPVYQTKWLKFGLSALGLADGYTIPRIRDSYSALFWMDYKDVYVPGGEAEDRDNYPYLGWACDHFHQAKKSPISNRDYPLTWEANASQADYRAISALSTEYARRRLAAPHTWHAAEVFLYLLEMRQP